MAIESIISWNAPTHVYTQKNNDWYWSVGIITLALAAVCFIFGQIIVGIFVIMAAVTLVLHASRPPKIVAHEINDRGVVIDNILYPFLSLESFWVPHDGPIPKLLIKSRKTLMPLIVILIDEVDPEEVRKVMLKYIAETEHHQQLLHHVFERLGF